MVCEVIVDIKNNQVNHPFDYLVPEDMEFVEKGCRVIVPFGSRKLLGFVINIKEESDFKALKPICSVLDYVPSISEEMLHICQKMAVDTNSFLITTLLTVIPSAMRVGYQKKLRKLSDEIDNRLLSYFQKKDEIEIGENLFPLMRIIRAEINKGNLEIIYEVKQNINIKEIKMLHLNRLDFINLTPKQSMVCDLLMGGDKTKAEVLKELGITSSVIEGLVKKGIIIEVKQEAYREIKHITPPNNKRVDLNKEQDSCYQSIKESFNNAKTFLLHGVTGSGKTEVYLNIIDDVIRMGKEAIMLVPEISLTPQMVSRFKGRFQDEVAIIHSGLSDGERYDEWRKIMRREVKIALGARSAIFAPFTNLGILIIDECHEASYKQDDSPRYNAKDIALWRSSYHNAPLILGSATPNVEDYYLAQKGDYQLLELKKRANGKPLPTSLLVNMCDELKQGNKSIFSKALKDLINDCLEHNNQAILLLNRRGHSSFVMCRSCGQTIKCPNCDVTLTYHQEYDFLKCHYCGYHMNNVHSCPSCQSNYIKYVGVGTEKVVEALNKEFPEARVLRMDHDTTAKKGSHELLLDRFGRHEADILVGTQMIAKGLDFPNVTLVGILMADLVLNLPDYRQSERTFDLISQVSGRAGRHDKDGQVVVQAYKCDHYSITNAVDNNYLLFYENELKMRRLFGYAPYNKIVQLILTGPIKNDLHQEGKKIINILPPNVKKHIGPFDPKIGRINNRYRVMITLYYQDTIDEFLMSLAERYQRDIGIIIDKQ